MSKKSTLIRDTFILTVITLVAGFALGLVYEVTAPLIEASRLAAKMDSYKVVFESASSFNEDEEVSKKAKEAVDTLFNTEEYATITVDEALVAVDENGNELGYVMSISTQKGYKGNITLSLGYSLDGTLLGMEVLSASETAGLGAKIAETSFKEKFANKQVDKFIVTKSGSTTDAEIDAISGATITTSAVVNTVNAGISFAESLIVE